MRLGFLCPDKVGRLGLFMTITNIYSEQSNIIIFFSSQTTGKISSKGYNYWRGGVSLTNMKKKIIKCSTITIISVDLKGKV